MLVPKLAGVAVAATLVAGVGAAALASGGDDFKTRLSGAEEAPGPGDPDGRGKAEIEIRASVSKSEVCFELEWDDIGTPTAGHIHQAPPRVPGPIVVDLLGGFTPDELERDDEVKACVPGDPAVLAAILADPGAYYVNVHNARFPAGAIRGQLDG